MQFNGAAQYGGGYAQASGVNSAGGTPMGFGKHRDLTYAEVIAQHPDYVAYILGGDNHTGAAKPFVDFCRATGVNPPKGEKRARTGGSSYSSSTNAEVLELLRGIDAKLDQLLSQQQ